MGFLFFCKSSRLGAKRRPQHEGNQQQAPGGCSHMCHARIIIPVPVVAQTPAWLSARQPPLGRRWVGLPGAAFTSLAPVNLVFFQPLTPTHPPHTRNLPATLISGAGVRILAPASYILSSTFYVPFLWQLSNKSKPIFATLAACPTRPTPPRNQLITNILTKQSGSFRNFRWSFSPCHPT